MYAQYVLFNKEVLLKGYNFEQKGLRRILIIYVAKLVKVEICET